MTNHKAEGQLEGTVTVLLKDGYTPAAIRALVDAIVTASGRDDEPEVEPSPYSLRGLAKGMDAAQVAADEARRRQPRRSRHSL